MQNKTVTNRAGEGAGVIHRDMNDHIGKDSTGSWTPAQYAIDAGWDYTCIEATAAKGVAESDAEGLTEAQQVALLAFCKSRMPGS